MGNLIFGSVLLQEAMAKGLFSFAILIGIVVGIIVFLLFTFLVKYVGLKIPFIIIGSLHLLISIILIILSGMLGLGFLLVGLFALLIVFLSYRFLKLWLSFAVLSIIHIILCFAVLMFLWTEHYENSSRYVGLWKVKPEMQEQWGYYIKRESNGNLYILDSAKNIEITGKWRDYSDDEFHILEQNKGGTNWKGEPNWEQVGLYGEDNCTDSLISE